MISIKDTVGIEVSYQTVIAYRVIRPVLKDRNINNGKEVKRKVLHYPFDCLFSELRKKSYPSMEQKFSSYQYCLSYLQYFKFEVVTIFLSNSGFDWL